MRYLILTLLLLIPAAGYADWQQDLEAQFDIVETFDQLQSWRAYQPGYIYNTDDMPKKLDGSPSIWTHYYGWADPATVTEDWIKDHGPGNNWYSNKSIRIMQGPLYCYNSKAEEGTGCTKIGTYFGDGTPESGYRDVYHFHMFKFNPLYWLRNKDGNTFSYNPTNKLWDLITGFKDIDDYGAPYCQPNQQEYGSCNWLFNSHQYSTSLHFVETQTRSQYDSTGDCYRYEKFVNEQQRGGLDYTDMFEHDEWIGMEVHAHLGTLDTADGSVEVWLYNEDGDVIATYSESGREILRHLDFSYNKYVLGANYQCLENSHRGRIKDTSKYYDDIIINGSRIGPTYFSMLFGPGPVRKKVTRGDAEYTDTEYTIEITTDVAATCKYSMAPNTAYDAMEHTLTSTGGTDHTETITGLSPGYDTLFYVRCSSDNTKDYIYRLHVPEKLEWYKATTQAECNNSDIGVWCNNGNYCFDSVCCEDDQTYCFKTSDCSDNGGTWCYEGSYGYLCRPPGKSCGDSFDAHELQRPTWCAEQGYEWDEEALECKSSGSVPPSRSNGQPVGEQPAGTTQVTMTITTNVAATCKYGADGVTGVEYDYLSSTFTTTGGTSHSTIIAGLNNGNNYSRAVRCSDGTVVNTTDYIISWSVASSSLGGGNLGAGTGLIGAGTGAFQRRE